MRQFDELKNSARYRGVIAGFLMCVAVLLGSPCWHRKRDSEAKLLLSPDQSQAAVAALNAKKEVTGHV
jgi:hypothetical protein